MIVDIIENIEDDYWYDETTGDYTIPIYNIIFTGIMPNNYKQLCHMCIGKKDGNIYGGM